MLFKLAWSNFWTRRFKFVQMKSIGSQMALSPVRGQKGSKKKNFRPNAKIFGMDHPNDMHVS